MQVFLFLTLIVVTIVILIPLQSEIDTRILEIKNQTISIIEKQINRKITYSSISPSLFMYLEFRDLAVIGKDRELININRIRIYYSLRELLSGKALNSLKEIKIIKSSFSFDYEKDIDLINLFTAEKVSNKINLPDIKISGKNLKIKLKKADNIIDFSRLFFTLNHKDEETQFTTKGKIKTLISQSKFSSGTARFSVTGSIKNNYQISNTLFVFKSIENDFIYSNQISLRASYKSGQFDLRKVEDSRPLDIKLSYSNLEKLIKINFNSENFIPLDYFEPKSIDHSILQWLGTSISGSGELFYNTDTREISYSADITANTNNSSIPKQAFITSSLKGGKSSVDFSNLKIKTIDGILAFKGIVNYNNFLPSGNIFISYNHPFSKIMANLTLLQNNDTLDIRGNNISIGNIELFNFITSINIFDKDLDFKTSLSLENIQDKTKDQIIIDGNFQYKPDFFLNLSINTENTPINSIIKSIPIGNNQYLKQIPVLYLNSDLFISTDLTKFSFSGPKIQFISKNDDEIKFSAFGNNESIDISNILAKWGDKYLEGSVKTAINKRSVQNIINVSYEDNSYSANISYYPNRGLFFEGMHGLSGSWYKSGNISEFNLSLLDFPIPVNGTITRLSLKTNGYFNNHKNWHANIDTLEFLNIPGMIAGNSLNISGEISEKDLNLTAVNYSDAISSLQGSGSFIHNLFSIKNLSGNFVLSSPEGEQYKGYISLLDKKIDFETDFTKAALNRFNKMPVSGLVNGNITLSGLIPKPDITMTLQLEKGEFNSSPLEIETSLELTEDKFLLNYLRLKYKNQVLQKGNGEYNVKSGDFFMDLEYLGIVQNNNLKALIGVKGKSELLNDKPSIDEILKSSYRTQFTINNILVNNKKSDSWDFQIDKNNQNTSFSGGPNESLDGYIDKSGNFNIISTRGLPLRGEAKGILADNMIDMRINNMEADLTLLNLIPYGDFLEFSKGTAYGQLNIAGQISDPLFNGVLHVDGAEGDVFMVPEEIEPFNGNIIIKERTINIGPEILNVNGSNVKVGIDLTINNWIPNTYSLNIETINQDSIHIIYDVPSVGLGIDGYVTGGMNISMDDYGTRIDSKLTADDCIINLGTINNESRKNESPVSANMEFTTGKKVQFIWPSNTLPILRATAEQGQTIILNMDNLNGTFSLIGKVNIKYGGIYYFQKSFYLSEGSIAFDETESKFDPFLGFIAQIKEVDAVGEVVNISLIQDKMPVSQFAPRFESDPPLSDVEIFSILGAGVFTELGNEQIDLTSALLLTGDLVTQFAIIRNFEKKVRNIFNLDLFSIRTQMIQNILIDRFIEDDTVEQDVYLDSFGRYLDNTTLYLGKYIGDDIFIQALLQINNQQFINTDLYASNKLLVESTISLEWQSPLFLLGFSVKPDFIDPISSIQNTSLELSWGYSY